MAKKKAWFGKRWTKSFIRWIDAKIFHVEDHEDFKLADTLFCRNFTLGMIGGVAAVVLSFFMRQEDAMAATAIAAGVCMLITLAWYFYKNLQFYNTPAKKIGRICFVFFLCLFATVLGYLIGIYTSIIAIAIFIIMFMLEGTVVSMGGSTNKSSSSYSKMNCSLETNDGLLYSHNAEQGQVYTGRDGNRYEFDGINFRRV